MSLRALVIDDSETVAGHLRSILRDLDPQAQVSVAGTLAAARRLLIVQQFDAVFLDLMLVDGHGLDLLWDIGRALPGGRVITMSGLPADHPHVAAARRLSADHIAKPLEPSSVARALGMGP